MHWLLLGILSAISLGIYDIFKKHAVSGNAVIPVLFFSTVAGGLCMAPFGLLSLFSPSTAHSFGMFVEGMPLAAHLQVLIKVLIVSSSWIAAYFALKHLPISLATPIRASQPVFTVLGAVLIFGERPSPWTLLGLAIILLSYWAFAKAGRIKGTAFKGLRWVLLMMLATALGATSAFYDKFLLQGIAYPPTTLQFWFAFYLVPVMGTVLLLFWLPNRKATTPFQWRWSIAAIGLFLIISDFVYFHALSDPSAMLSVLSALRRSNAVISFTVGGLLFHDAHLKAKALPLIGIIIGMAIILLTGF